MSEKLKSPKTYIEDQRKKLLTEFTLIFRQKLVKILQDVFYVL